MTNAKSNTQFTRGERFTVILFAVLFGLYVLNVLIGKATIVFGWKLFHFDNIGEFLILLTASVAFIVAALHREATSKENQEPVQEREGSYDGKEGT